MFRPPDDPDPLRLPEPIDQLLLERAEIRRLAPGHYIFAEGAAPTHAYRVLEGAVRVSSIARNGREAVLGHMNPGRWFGTVGILAAQSRLYQAVTTAATRVAVVTAENFRAVLDDRPDALMAVTRALCLELQATYLRLKHVVQLNFGERLLQCLLALARCTGQDDAGASVRYAVTQDDLALLMGVSRQRVNRELLHWQQRGLVVLSYRLIDIPNLRRLRLHLSDEPDLQPQPIATPDT